MESSKQEGPLKEKQKHSSRSRSKSRKRARKRQEEDDGKKPSQPLKRGRRCQPLNGYVLSVSTLAGEAGKDSSTTEATYNSVSQLCKELGAEVKTQVCKRVQVLVSTRSAVQKATQRIRKAFKKRIPIVDVGWLDKCRLEGKRVDLDSFRLDKEAEAAINNRLETLDKQEPATEVDPNAGWSEPVAVGCCCVCHENGSEKDCKWCADADCSH